MSVTLGLMKINSYCYCGATPFTSLIFTMFNGVTSIVSKTFTTLATAHTWFNIMIRR